MKPTSSKSTFDQLVNVLAEYRRLVSTRGLNSKQIGMKRAEALNLIDKFNEEKKSKEKNA